MDHPTSISAFSLYTRDGLARALISDIHIGPGFDRNKSPVPQLHPFKAIWDTGATNCVITQKVVDACQLKPISMAEVHHYNGMSICEVYYIAVMLPNEVGLPAIRATKAAIIGDEDVLIGMDIITRGDFIITNCDKKTVFSFRTPSLRHIDYVEQIKRIKEGKVGKNASCPCGSGYKFKRCCAKHFR